MKVSIRNEKNSMLPIEAGNSVMVQTGKKIFWMFEDAQGKIRIESKDMAIPQVSANEHGKADSVTLTFGRN